MSKKPLPMSASPTEHSAWTNAPADNQVGTSSTSERATLWPSRRRGAPWAFVRGGLFASLQRGKHPALSADTLPIATGMRVVLSGERPNQYDFDTWLQCCHLAKDAELGAVIHVSERKVQQALGRATGSNDLKCLRRSLARLAQADVDVAAAQSAYTGMLIEGYVPLEKGQFAFRMNPAMWPFLQRGYVQLDLSERLSLQGHPLAQWLHAFYASHRTTISLKVERLAAWCGSQATSMPDFRDRLKASLDLVRDVTGSITWRFDRNGNVFVEKRTTQKPDKYLMVKEMNPGMSPTEIKQLMAYMEQFEAKQRNRAKRPPA